MNRAATEELIRRHEGCEYISYDDSAGLRTVAIGFNLEKEGAQTRIEALGLPYKDVYAGKCTLTDQHCSALFSVDLDDAIHDARTIVRNFDEQPDDIQSVIVDMIYNLGAAGFANFKKTILAFEGKDYCNAAIEMKTSRWAKQVPNRASDDITIVMGHCHA